MLKKIHFLILLMGGVISLIVTLRADLPQLAYAANLRNHTTTAYQSRFDLERATIDVAERVGKAVVSISTLKVEKLKVRRYYFGSPFDRGFEDELIDKFFEDFFGVVPQRERRQRGLGSGVIINSEGYILTNEHVVGDADQLTVKLPDGREFAAEIKGVDTRSDLAVIKINAENLPFAELGDSDSVRIGQWVAAIGNPFGFALENPEPTITVGVVSALQRSLGGFVSSERDYSDLIQTDAAINPGNSGGPLVDMEGKVIGINVAIFSTTGGYQGIGFAIPINDAKRVLSELISGKKIKYGWLGVNIQNINDNLAAYFNLNKKTGVMIVGVLPNSPAEKAGIKEQDIIISFDNHPIKDTRELVKLVADTQVGKKVAVEILREGKMLIKEVVVGERPSLSLGGYQQDTQVEADVEKWRGLSVQPIDNLLSKKFNIRETKGVVVVEVEPDSLADQAGLMVGDVILSLNRISINSIADYKMAVNSLRGDVLIRTNRGYFVIKQQN